MICEGALAYLNDTIQWRKTYHDTTPTQYLTDKINWHNDRMDSMRKFTAGITCTVTNSTDNVYRQDNDLPSTLDNIQKKLIDRLGGYLDVDYVSQFEQDSAGSKHVIAITRGIKYIAELPELTRQSVRLGINLLSCEKERSVNDLVTLLIPTGATVESTGLPLTIEGVNDGHTYVESSVGVEIFGNIWGTHSWNDVTDASNLKAKAQEYVDDLFDQPWSVTISAADLMYNGESDVPLEYGHKILVESSRDNVAGWFDCTDEEIYLADPSKNKYTIGGRKSSLSKWMSTSPILSVKG